MEIARRAGVQRPEKVRLVPVANIPLPEDADLQKLARAPEHPSPVARTTLCRHSPEVGARCVNRARRDLKRLRRLLHAQRFDVAAPCAGL